MLSAKENELLTRVGEATPMGRFLRRFWLPVMFCKELIPDGPPKQAQLLGQRLVAFRDTLGRVGVLDEDCPHRGASLALGRNEECGLRCLYHAWKIDVQGNILETPPEPEASTFKDRIKHTAYPVREQGGVVWAYLGPPSLEPPLPDFEWCGIPGDQVYLSKVREECNWVQALEGVLDPAHASFLHSDTFGAPEGLDVPGRHQERTVGTSGDLGLSTRDGRPRLEVVNTDYGFKCAAIRKALVEQDRQQHVRVSHFVAPFYGIFPAGTGWGNLQIFAPMDDYRTMQYFIAYKLTSAIEAGEWRDLEVEAGARLGIDIDSHFRKLRTPENDWLQDREAMKHGASFSGFEGIGNEDMAVQESMGPIYDRSKEHLGTSDLAVIRMRRLMIDAARLIQAGQTEDLLGLRPEITLRALRGFDSLIPTGEPWGKAVAKAGGVAAGQGDAR